MHLQSEGKGGTGSGKAAPPAAAAGKKGAAGTVGGGSAPLDEEGALRIIQAVITAKPEPSVAEQQLKEAVAKVTLFLGFVLVIPLSYKPFETKLKC